jgi:hypothetical protein
MALPVLTTAEDVRELVRFLKNKPTGATIAEAKAALKKQVLNPRKMTPYTLWGFVTKEGERLKLTPSWMGLREKARNRSRRFPSCDRFGCSVQVGFGMGVPPEA